MFHELCTPGIAMLVLFFCHTHTFTTYFHTFITLQQCLSNTQLLTDYFIGPDSEYKMYKKRIDKQSPLGMRGTIAEAYGALLEDMWSRKMSCVAPHQFKVSQAHFLHQSKYQLLSREYS